MALYEHQGNARGSTGTATGSYATGSGFMPYRPLSTPEEMRSILKPLTRKLRHYDSLRLKLESVGGPLDHIQEIINCLNEVIKVKGRLGVHRGVLTRPETIRDLIYDSVGYTVHLDIRRQNHGMPSYYVCRIRKDYWLGASVIVEDLYRSPGHPVQDDRFAKIMQAGHEQSLIRASPFREGVLALLESDGRPASPWEIDDFLFDVGRECLGNMWHEDQLLGIMVADHFGLPKFKQTIELLYLILGGDLCGLRGSAHPLWNSFFAHVYPHPGLTAFLHNLPLHAGRELGELPTLALKQFAGLIRKFRAFLDTEVALNRGSTPVAMYKIILGNFYNLQPVAARLRNRKHVARAIRVLEERAEDFSEHLVALPGGHGSDRPQLNHPASGQEPES